MARWSLPMTLFSVLLPVCGLSGADDTPAGAETTPLANSKAEVYLPGAGRAPVEPVRLPRGPHLFMDDFLIADMDNVTREVNRPCRDAATPNPIVTGKEDGCFQPYMTVHRDEQTGRFRLWYGHRREDMDTGNQRVGYMESADGIHWERPARVLDDPAPMQFGVSIVDEGPAFANPAQRYKLAYWKDGGLRIACSPDGLAWTPLVPEVVLRHNHDITGIFHDPLRNRHIATVSVYRPGDRWIGDRRVTMHAFSDDFIHWSPPHYVVTPDDALDGGQTQFYAMDGYLVRGGLIVGMVKVLRDDLKADNPPDPPEAYGVGYTTLAWSRDGETWTRDREHFFDPDPRPGAWDHAHAWIDEQLIVGDDLYLYYGGYARGHKVNRFEERQIGLVKTKRDRYVARAASGVPGRIRTPRLLFDARALTINAEAPRAKFACGFSRTTTAPPKASIMRIRIPSPWMRWTPLLHGNVPSTPCGTRPCGWNSKSATPASTLSNCADDFSNDGLCLPGKAFQPADGFDVRRMREKIHGGYPNGLPSMSREHAEIAGERRRIA